MDRRIARHQRRCREPDRGGHQGRPDGRDGRRGDRGRGVASAITATIAFIAISWAAGPAIA
ncbi:hypothetical protein [Clavibacter tessellarius]|uniref:hypothetical protein n=1 Tax=Clavibacter tessellarius TaxID=31965 RepID=UPI0032465002